MIAVYPGWRGQSQPIPVLQELGTFYSRKAARVGYTGAPLLFGALERKKGELVAKSLKCPAIGGDENNRAPSRSCKSPMPHVTVGARQCCWLSLRNPTWPHDLLLFWGKARTSFSRTWDSEMSMA